MRSAFCSVGGVRLHYLDWGATGPAMLLLPGLSFTAYIYAELAPHYTDFHTPWEQRSLAQFRQQAGGQIVELPATQHLCFVHRQEAVVRAMRAFLER